MLCPKPSQISDNPQTAGINYSVTAHRVEHLRIEISAIIYKYRRKCSTPTFVIFATFFMSYNPEIHHRRSIRLQGYDYTNAGVYFVTICCYQRQHLFGSIDNGEMEINRNNILSPKISVGAEHYRHNLSIFRSTQYGNALP